MTDRVARPLTLIFVVPDEVTANRHDVYQELLSTLMSENLACVQFVPKHCIRVTFKTLEARQAVLTSGVVLGSSHLTVFEADPTFTEVSIEHLPFEVPDDVIRETLSPYGAVQEISFQNYASSNVYTGTRLVKMSLVADIPVNLRFLRYPCRVLYRGQPRSCYICRADDHRAYACPIRGKCRTCLRPGHIARDCPTVRDPPYAPEEDADDTDDDSTSEDDDMASGDREVVEAACAADTASPVAPLVPEPPPPIPEPPLPEPPIPEPPIPDPPIPDSPITDPTPPVPPKMAEPLRAPEPAGDGSPAPVSMSDRPFWVTQLKWIQRFTPESFDRVLATGHSADSHIFTEEYPLLNGRLMRRHCLVDYGRNTYRVMKDVKTFEDVRLNDIRTGRVEDLGQSTFPGAVLAGFGPALSPNVPASKFPTPLK